MNWSGSRRGISQHKSMEGRFSLAGSGDPLHLIRLEGNTHSGEGRKEARWSFFRIFAEDYQKLLNDAKQVSDIDILEKHTGHNKENGLESARLQTYGVTGGFKRQLPSPTFLLFFHIFY